MLAVEKTLPPASDRILQQTHCFKAVEFLRFELHSIKLMSSRDAVHQ